MCQVYREYLDVSLCEGFTRADTSAAREQGIYVAASLWAARSKRKRMIVVKMIGLKPLGVLPVIFVSVKTSDFDLNDISRF